MKTSVEFSYRKPVLTSLIIFTITFVLLHFEAFGNPVRTIAWKHHFILAYSLIAGSSFFIYYALFSTIINSKNWNLWKDISAFLLILVLVTIFILLFNIFYIETIDSNYNDNFVHDGRLYYYMCFVGIVNFLIIKFLDFYQYHKQKAIKGNVEKSQKIILEGKNKYEKIILDIDDLVLIEAFGNYVLVHYLNHENHIEKNIIRNSFSIIGEQLETIEKMKRIHRSYIVNIDKVINLEMRNRKATAKIKFIDEMIPVSKASLREIETFLMGKK